MEIIRVSVDPAWKASLPHHFLAAGGKLYIGPAPSFRAFYDQLVTVGHFETVQSVTNARCAAGLFRTDSGRVMDWSAGSYLTLPDERVVVERALAAEFAGSQS